MVDKIFWNDIYVNIEEILYELVNFNKFYQNYLHYVCQFICVQFF